MRINLTVLKRLLGRYLEIKCISRNNINCEWNKIDTDGTVKLCNYLHIKVCVSYIQILRSNNAQSHKDKNKVLTA